MTSFLLVTLISLILLIPLHSVVGSIFKQSACNCGLTGDVLRDETACNCGVTGDVLRTKNACNCGVTGNVLRTKNACNCGVTGDALRSKSGVKVHAISFVVISFRCLRSVKCIVISNVSSADRKTKLTLMLTEH
jgi:hypothetical protein